MKLKKNRLLLIVTLLVILFVLLLLQLLFHNVRETFNNEDTILSELNNSAGFFSMFFFTLNHYLYCKKNNISFKLKSDDWLFKKELGWEDYFLPIELTNNNSNTHHFKIVSHPEVLQDFAIEEYRDIIPEIYIYNENTKREIQKAREKLQLVNKPYDSIFIRRGDKLANESKFYDTDEYIRLLLKKNPYCKTIFLQTDDYNTYLDLQKYNHDNHLGLEIVTLCDENMRGVVVNSDYKNILKNAQDTNENEKNRNYLNKINEHLEKTKPVNEMNPDEKYEHTLTMIIGIELLVNSTICICDYQSNVSRFVKLLHKTPNNVYDIMNSEKDIDYQKKICPAHSF
jgi:hypothetical protein